MTWIAVVASLYIGAMAVSLILGRPSPIIWGVVALNFVGSLIFFEDAAMLGIVDAMTLALLIADWTWLSLSLAFCFAICIALDAFGLKFGLSPATLSTVVDFMIIPLALIIGCVDGDGGNLSRWLGAMGYPRRTSGYFDPRADGALESRRHAANHLAPHSVVAEGEVNRGPR